MSIEERHETVAPFVVSFTDSMQFTELDYITYVPIIFTAKMIFTAHLNGAYRSFSGV